MNKRAVTHLRKDPRLAVAIDMVGDYNIRVTRNRFESLVRSIITQQISVPVARSILKRFRSLYGTRFPRPADVAATPKPRLQRAGLSGMKAEYIRDLARGIDCGKIRLSRISGMPDEEAIAELTKIRGVGIWTAQMFLMFTLGRTDVLPAGDLGLQRGVMKLYSLRKMPTEKQVTRIADTWRPFRTAATWYVWKSLDFEDI